MESWIFIWNDVNTMIFRINRVLQRVLILRLSLLIGFASLGIYGEAQSHKLNSDHLYGNSSYFTESMFYGDSNDRKERCQKWQTVYKKSAGNASRSYWRALTFEKHSYSDVLSGVLAYCR